jgi:hypothetical protein
VVEHHAWHLRHRESPQGRAAITLQESSPTGSRNEAARVTHGTVGVVQNDARVMSQAQFGKDGLHGLRRFAQKTLN